MSVFYKNWSHSRRPGVGCPASSPEICPSGYIPDFLRECVETPIVQRIKSIGMNCGCEYTAFPQFADIDSYSRYDHSIGVALIIWHFTHDRKQAIADLLHDVASPVFAHVVDFMHGDYLTQESTEDGTEMLIANSTELQAVLKKYELSTGNVAQYFDEVLFPLNRWNP